MRLTADLILQASAHVNPCQERELILRDYNIGAIENLGATKDAFDCIDLTNNNVSRLEDFPRLRRLRTLLISANSVRYVSDLIPTSLPNLDMLILTNNKVGSFADVAALAKCSQLTILSLENNPISKKPNYRQYVVHLLPQLRVLDNQKVSPKERAEARALAATAAGRQVLAAMRAEVEARQEAPVPEAAGAGAAAGGGGAEGRFSAEQLTQIKRAIEAASTPEEIQRLEKALRTGEFSEEWLRGVAGADGPPGTTPDGPPGATPDGPPGV